MTPEAQLQASARGKLHARTIGRPKGPPRDWPSLWLGPLVVMYHGKGRP